MNRKRFLFILVFVFMFGIFNTIEVAAKNASIGYDKECYKIVKTEKVKDYYGNLLSKTQHFKNKKGCALFSGKMVRNYKNNKEVKAVLHDYTLLATGKAVVYEKTTFSKYKKSAKKWGYTLVKTELCTIKKNKYKLFEKLTTKTLTSGQALSKHYTYYDEKERKYNTSYIEHNKKGIIVKSVSYYFNKKGQKISSDYDTYDNNGNILLSISCEYNSKGKIISGRKAVYKNNKVYFYNYKNGKWVLDQVNDF